MNADFTMRIGEDTQFPATIEFVINNDICGEGYEGHDYVILFDDPKFHSPLCVFKGVQADDIKAEAALTYREFVLFIKAAQS